MFEEIVTKDEVKFNDLEKKIFKFVCVFGCLIIKLLLENYDKKLMKDRDTKKYRHKGLRKNTIKTIMGEVEYKRAMYEIEENGIKKTVYLLDETLKIKQTGKISENVVEKVVDIVPITDSYRKAETVIKETTNLTLSFEAIRKIIVKLGDKITSKEKEEIKFLNKEQLVAGTKEIIALFEEADGLWINLQGKDRKKRLEEIEEKCKKENKFFNAKQKIKTELKLHIMYEGCKKGDKRHTLIGKEYIAGIMKPREISKLRDARVYQKYDEKSIKLRVLNGDGAHWTKGIYQKDQFHIMQEIIRDVPKEYRNILNELIEKKRFKEIPKAIEGLKYEIGGEEKAIQKLNTLQSYLSSGLPRYTDIVEVPQAPEGIEYRTLGTQESQIFSKLKKRFCSGRKAFSEHGANSLAKICVVSEKFNLEDIETEIPIDTSVEDWIKEIEENVKRNKTTTSSYITTENHIEGKVYHESHIEHPAFKEIMKLTKFTEMSFIKSYVAY